MLHRCLAVLLLSGTVGLSGSLSAQEDRPAPTVAQARMPVKIIGDRLVVRCEVSTRVRRIPVNLFLDYGRTCKLELHNQAANGLRADENGGRPIRIHLQGFDLRVKGREHGDEDALNDFTRLYSKQLGETACVGSLGSGLLGDYQITFDLPAGFVYLKPKAEKLETPPAEDESSTVVSVDVHNRLVWFPVRLPDDSLAVMNLGTGRVDTVIDRDWCTAGGKPAGDVGKIMLKSIDLSRYVAFRPVELTVVHPERAIGTLGLNLLAHLRIEVDRVNRFARITPKKEPSFPTADLEFFRALVQDEAGGFEGFLKDHVDHRCAREAAGRLLEILIDEGDDTERCKVALEWMDKTRIEDLRATEALTTMDTLLAAGRPKVAVEAGRIGIKSGRKDRYPESVHKLHARLGELLLEQDDGDAAWGHLLAAAFGLPEDGMINLNLGRFYEKQKRYRRAMSRYVQAVITPEAGPQAVAGLERVQEQLGGKRLSVDLVDRMVAGKVHNFGAATKYKPKKGQQIKRCVLAELFTNAHFGRPLTEGWRSFAIGGAMAAEGLLSHFERKHVVVLAHHLPVPEPTALSNPFSEYWIDRYEIDGPVYFLINGTERKEGAGRWRKAEALYEGARAAAQTELGRRTPFSVTLSASIKDGTITGQARVSGKRRSATSVQIVLAERGVLYPGKAKIVVHRMVARAQLTGKNSGVPFKPKDGHHDLAFSASIADLEQRNIDYLKEREKTWSGAATRLSTRFDPEQLAVIVIVRDAFTLEVLQCGYADVTTAEKD